MDNIAETTAKKYLTATEKTNLNTGKKPDGTAISLDSLSDGTTYRRVKAGAVDSSGQIDLSSTLVVNKTLDNIAETTAKKYLTATEKTNFSDGKKADGTYITADQVGAVSQKTAGTQLLINDWEIGSGSTGFYTINGATSENYRVYGLNPKDERAILWECRPDAVSDADGGWLTDSFAIDKTKSYRFSVFAKTNANSGTTYLGCKANSVCNLNTATKNSNPYFWSGDLPENNKWYLIVGYIFPAGETGLITQGGIYDCLTGRKVSGVSASFNWASDALDSIHRCYHYYDTNTGTRQWMYNPRVDLIDGNEPSITALLGKIAAEDIKYLNDKTLEELRPAAANADVTGQNTALDTQKVNGVLASTVYHTGNKPTAADVGATTSSDVTTIADGRIATKIGSDTVIGYLKAGKKSDGNYITATNVGARANTWTPIAADLPSDIPIAKISSLQTSLDAKQPSIYASNTAPTGIATGALWIDTTSSLKIMKRYNGATWEKVTPTTASEVGATTSSEVSTIADGRIATKIGSDTVIGYLKAGKKSDGNFITATDVGARANTWTPIAADLPSDIPIAKISSLQTSLDAKQPSIYASNTAPTGIATGALWIDTTSSLKIMKRYNGATWEKVTPTTASEVGATTSTEVSTIADGRIATKIGTDTVIGYLKAGKKSDGNYITATNVGARASTWTPAVADLPTGIPQSKVQSLTTDLAGLTTRITNAEGDISDLQQAANNPQPG